MFEKLKKFSSSWTATFLYIFLFMSFGFQAFKIPSGSMETTLLIGDSLFVKKFSYGIPTPYIPFFNVNIIPGTDGHLVDWGTPKRGEIVVFRLPQNNRVFYVKRLIGLPGDKLFMVDKVLYMNFKEGKKWMIEHYNRDQIVTIDNLTWVKNPFFKKYPGIHNTDEFVKAPSIDREPTFNFPVTEVPENEYFMLGDNRDNSKDSRYIGTVPFGLFLGNPAFIFFSSSPDKFRLNRIFSVPE